MTCSVEKTLARGIALMAIAVALAGANAALAVEPNDDALVVTAPSPAATPNRELVSAPVDPKTEPVLPRTATEPVRLERPPLRPRRVVRRDDDGPRVREAAAGERRPRYASGPVWHRSNGGGGMGVVLGVGF
jgi:hypothetical protein